MTWQKPRIGWNNLFEKYRASLWASSETTNQEAENAVDWSPDTRWIPEWSRTLIDNSDMLEWAGGASAAPDDFTLAGAGATIAQNTADAEVGPYCAAITRAGADASLYADAATPATWAGKHMVAWIRAKTSTASQTRVRIGDGTSTADSSYHTGGGAFEWLKAEFYCGKSPTRVRLEIQVNTTDGTAYIDRVVLHESNGDDQEPTIPEAAYLYVHPVPNQELSNGIFESWPDGPAADPANWALTGSGASVHLSAEEAQVGRYACELTRSGADCYLEQTLTSTQLARAKGRTLSFGGKMKTSTANQAKVQVVATFRDATTHQLGELVHGGGGSWAWSSGTTAAVPHDATAVSVRAAVETSDGAAFFDGLVLAIGETVADPPTATSVAAFGFFGHNGGTAGATLTLQGSDDNATWSSVVAVTPTTDRAHWRDKDHSSWDSASGNAVSYEAYRVKITPPSGGGERISIGGLFVGPILELPKYVPPGFDPYARKMRATSPLLGSSAPAGRGVQSEPIPIRLEQRQHIAESFVTGDLADFEEHAGERGTPGGKPFLLAWDSGDHGSEVLLCWLTDDATISKPLRPGSRVGTIVLDMLAVPE